MRIKDGDIAEASCNKYFSCKTYDQLQEHIEELESAIRKAVNAPPVDWELSFQQLEEVLRDE